jgi:hypothetical protein
MISIKREMSREGFTGERCAAAFGDWAARP